jgi:hypothetical protein
MVGSILLPGNSQRHNAHLNECSKFAKFSLTKSSAGFTVKAEGCHPTEEEVAK